MKGNKWDFLAVFPLYLTGFLLFIYFAFKGYWIIILVIVLMVLIFIIAGKWTSYCISKSVEEDTKRLEELK